ncbi:MAG: hypothetical protein ACD_49C00026G0027 [uncultured bacterium (gcode 4)]|uniref:Uncharacterized protein n=1 Tax=uncultured bacterium (gcode 4) TaxID=1234023 RepID=K2AY76_9BACT|nr:MAG: hypothetical protein ACD_49C00026G0027 [uncultured bacterium (gcode 4)]
MSETYNKNWACEIKSTDIKNDWTPDSKIGKDKEDKVRSAAIDMINNYSIRSLPAERFNKLVEEMKEVLRRKDIDEEKLRNEFWDVLDQEKEIIKLKEKINSFESTFKSFYDTINSVWVTDAAIDWSAWLIDKIAWTKMWWVWKSLKENFENSKKIFLGDYQKIKDYYEKNKDKLSEKQKEEFEKIIKKWDSLAKLKIEDPSFAQMVKSQWKNTWDQISDVAKTVKATIIPNSKPKASPKKEVKKISKNKSRLEFFLNELWIDIKEIDWMNEKELRKFFDSKKIDKNKQDYLIDLYLKNPKGNNIEYRPVFLSSDEILKVVDPKNKWKNTRETNEDKINSNTSSVSNKKSENHNFISSREIIISTNNEEKSFDDLLENISSWKDWKIKNLSFNDGFKFSISKTGNSFILNYWDRKETCKNLDEVKNVVEMWRYIKKLWLWFLIWDISKILIQIRSKSIWNIEEKDGLSKEEMRLWLISIWKALIPGFDSTKSDIKELERQFTDKDIFNAKIEDVKRNTNNNDSFSCKLRDKNIWGFSSLEELAKFRYSKESDWKDFSISAFLKNI